jgi:hypothetical protein
VISRVRIVVGPHLTFEIENLDVFLLKSIFFLFGHLKIWVGSTGVGGGKYWQRFYCSTAVVFQKQSLEKDSGTYSLKFFLAVNQLMKQ